MNPDNPLKNAVLSVGLSTAPERTAACHLAILLLERIFRAEEEELDWLDVCLHRYNDEYRAICLAPYEAIVDGLGDALRSLYGTYGLTGFLAFRHS